MNPYKPYKFKNGTIMRNAFALAPMTTYSANEDLTLSDEEENYYYLRSKNLGMVITAAAAVNKNAQAFDRQISVRDERYYESMKRLRKAIQAGGALAVLQIHHGGRMNVPNMYANQEILAPSAVKANRDYAETPRAMRTSEVYDTIDDFVSAAKLAMKAGFDGVEIHGANTYLLQQFFSPHSNRRDDEFGGNLEKRMTFPRKIVEGILQAKEELNKPNFLVGYRFSPEELENPGITINDTLQFVDVLADYPIDYLHVSLGKFDQTSIRDDKDKEAIGTKLLRMIDGRVPLMGVGGISTSEDVDKAANLGYDLLSVGMVALADPDVVLKFQLGEAPSNIFKHSTLPEPLYTRLHRYGSRLVGYHFEEE